MLLKLLHEELVKLYFHFNNLCILEVKRLKETYGEIIHGIGVSLIFGAKKAQFDLTMAIHPTASEEFVTMYEPFLDAAE